MERYAHTNGLMVRLDERLTRLENYAEEILESTSNMGEQFNRFLAIVVIGFVILFLYAK